MSSSVKISNLFNKFSWTSFIILVVISIIVFIVSVVSYTSWKKLDVPEYQNCKPGFTKNFDNLQVNGSLEIIPVSNLPSTNVSTNVNEHSPTNASTINISPSKSDDEYGPGPFKSIFKNKYSGFFETNGINNFNLEANISSQESPFTLVVEESDDTNSWKPIQNTLTTSKVGETKIEFTTSSNYLRLSLVSFGRNVVISSLKIVADVEKQNNKKDNVEKTMFGSVISSTLLMTILIVFFIVMFVDIRKVYEYVVKEQNVMSEKNK